jgi:hypothetical protein
VSGGWTIYWLPGTPGVIVNRPVLIAGLVIGAGHRPGARGDRPGSRLPMGLLGGGAGRRGRRLAVLVQGRAPGDDRPGGEGRDARLERHARAPGADRNLGDARRGDLLSVGQPGHERIGRERRGGGAQRGAGAQQQLAQGTVAHAQLAGDVGVRAIGHGDRDERGTLAIRQGLDAVQRLAQLLAPLDLGLEADGRQVRGHGRQRRAGRAQRVERLVVRDPVQPRAQLAHVGTGAQCLPRAHEGRLQHILRERLAQQPAQIALKGAAVALDDRLERPIVAVGRERREPTVALGAAEESTAEAP